MLYKTNDPDKFTNKNATSKEAKAYLKDMAKRTKSQAKAERKFIEREVQKYLNSALWLVKLVNKSRHFWQQRAVITVLRVNKLSERELAEYKLYLFDEIEKLNELVSIHDTVCLPYIARPASKEEEYYAFLDDTETERIIAKNKQIRQAARDNCKQGRSSSYATRYVARKAVRGVLNFIF